MQGTLPVPGGWKASFTPETGNLGEMMFKNLVTYKFNTPNPNFFALSVLQK